MTQKSCYKKSKAKPTLVNPENGHQILGPVGESSYFQGGRRDYGRYSWCIKYHGFQSEIEIEAALLWAFGDHVALKTGGRGFDGLSELVGRPLASFNAGRSGGWLVVDTELSAAELRKITAHVASCLKALPEFLKNEREFHRDEASRDLKEETDRRTALATDKRLAQAVSLIKSIAGDDASLVLHGIPIDLQTGKPREAKPREATEQSPG